MCDLTAKIFSTAAEDFTFSFGYQLNLYLCALDGVIVGWYGLGFLQSLLLVEGIAPYLLESRCGLPTSLKDSQNENVYELKGVALGPGGSWYVKYIDHNGDLSCTYVHLFAFSLETYLDFWEKGLPMIS